MKIEEKRSQVADQCRVIAHLAKAIAGIHLDYERLFRDHPNLDQIVDVIGERTANLMDVMGDFLNSIDAVTDEDNWTHPIFLKAQEMFPGAPQ